MKIYAMLHFPLAGAGTGVFADTLASVLTQRGHQVKVLCADHRIRVKPYHVKTVLFKHGANTNCDIDFDFPVFSTHPLSQGVTFGELTNAQKRIYYQTLKDIVTADLALFSPDIVHVYHGWVIGAILAHLDVPYVISLHGTEYHAFTKYSDYQDLALQGIRNARTIITLTEQERTQAILAYGADPMKTVVVPLAINVRKFRRLAIDKATLCKIFNIKTTTRPVVLFAGRLTEQKGVDTLIRAAEIYSRYDPEPITLIAGEGSLSSALKTRVNAMALHAIQFLGRIEHEEMMYLYNLADIVVMPSVYEPLPLVAMEAMACGTPIIASKVGGLPQIVHEHIGYLFDAGDYETLAQTIRMALLSHFKEQIGDRLIEHVERHFDIHLVANSYQQVYEGAYTAR